MSFSNSLIQFIEPKLSMLFISLNMLDGNILSRDSVYKLTLSNKKEGKWFNGAIKKEGKLHDF